MTDLLAFAILAAAVCALLGSVLYLLLRPTPTFQQQVVRAARRRLPHDVKIVVPDAVIGNKDLFLDEAMELVISASLKAFAEEKADER